jgi:SAM-dependent methyltransferase
MSSAGSLQYGRIAQTYAAALNVLGFRRGVERFLDRLALRLPPGARVLDAGCGTGLLAFWLLGRFSDVHVLAFDVDPGMLAIARRRHARWGWDGRLELAIGDLRRSDRVIGVADGRRIGLTPSTFDAVFVGAALEHVPLRETVGRLHELLRPAGLILILAVRERGVGAALGHLYRFRPYALSHLHAALASCGLVEIRTVPLRSREFPANLSRVAILARRPHEPDRSGPGPHHAPGPGDEVSPAG